MWTCFPFSSVMEHFNQVHCLRCFSACPVEGHGYVGGQEVGSQSALGAEGGETSSLVLANFYKLPGTDLGKTNASLFLDDPETFQVVLNYLASSFVDKEHKTLHPSNLLLLTEAGSWDTKVCFYSSVIYVGVLFGLYSLTRELFRSQKYTLQQGLNVGEILGIFHQGSLPLI